MLDVQSIIDKKNIRDSRKDKKKSDLMDLSEQVKDYIINSNIESEFTKIFKVVRVDKENNPYCDYKTYEMSIDIKEYSDTSRIRIASGYNSVDLKISYYSSGVNFRKDFIIPLYSNKTATVKIIKNAFEFLFCRLYEQI